jgi:integrase
VNPHFVQLTLPHVLPPVAAMIQLQQLCGCRPGEIVQMRACDIDMTEKAWTFRPVRHKNKWRGMDRLIVLGPRAQKIVCGFLTMDTQSPLFSPAKALANRAFELRAKRKTRVQPSQQNRRAKARKRPPGFVYTRGAYTQAVAKGCDKADRFARQQAEDAVAKAENRLPVKVPKMVPDNERLVPRWCPLQLRHLHGTEVRRAFGLEAAQVALGHSEACVTQVYAERNLALAEKVALEVG